MDASRNHRLTLVWLALVAITALAWLVGGGAGNHNLDTAATVTILVISSVKARVIMREFMEIRTASARLKRWSDAWIGFTLTMLLIAYFFGSALWRWMDLHLLHLL